VTSVTVGGSTTTKVTKTKSKAGTKKKAY
jgi:hypothetical protein